MLKELFDRLFAEDYIMKPRHMILPMLMISVGFKALINYDWAAFGLTFIILGVIFSLAVSFNIAWRGPIEYWEKIREVTEAMNRIRNPEIWKALGFKSLPETITIEETVKDNHGVTVQWKMKRPEISPLTLNMIANKVLLSGSLDFTEEQYKDKVKNFRKVRKELKDNGYITPKNKNNVRNGYAWSKKGVDMLYQCADENVLKLVQKGETDGEKSE